MRLAPFGTRGNELPQSGFACQPPQRGDLFLPPSLREVSRPPRRKELYTNNYNTKKAPADIVRGRLVNKVVICCNKLL